MSPKSGYMPKCLYANFSFSIKIRLAWVPCVMRVKAVMFLLFLDPMTKLYCIKRETKFLVSFPLCFDLVGERVNKRTFSRMADTNFSTKPSLSTLRLYNKQLTFNELMMTKDLQVDTKDVLR